MKYLCIILGAIILILSLVIIDLNKCMIEYDSDRIMYQQKYDTVKDINSRLSDELVNCFIKTTELHQRILELREK